MAIAYIGKISLYQTYDVKLKKWLLDDFVKRLKS